MRPPCPICGDPECKFWIDYCVDILSKCLTKLLKEHPELKAEVKPEPPFGEYGQHLWEFSEEETKLYRDLGLPWFFSDN